MYDLAKSIAGSLAQVVTGTKIDSTLRERIDLWRERAAAMQEDMARLADDKRRLEDELSRLKEELARRPDPAVFLTYRGVLWRKEENGYGIDPHCPRCQVAMSQVPNEKRTMGITINPIVCSLCKFKAPFDYGEQLNIHEELIKKLGNHERISE
jgi:hypothetical protein